jgi:hypothetical protein
VVFSVHTIIRCVDQVEHKRQEKLTAATCDIFGTTIAGLHPEVCSEGHEHWYKTLPCGCIFIADDET